MKYIKIFVIVILAVFLCGCTKEYKLYINDNGIVEKFHMDINSDNEYSFLLDGDFYPLHNDYNHKFKKNLKNKGNNKFLDIEYKYTFKSFINANSFNQCFDERNITNSKKYYTISLSKPNGCMFKNDYVINIITDNKVVENNANEIKGNKYVWYVENNSDSNFKLLIKVEKGTGKTTAQKYSFIAYIIIGIVIIGVLAAGIILIKKYNQNKKA